MISSILQGGSLKPKGLGDGFFAIRNTKIGDNYEI